MGQNPTRRQKQYQGQAVQPLPVPKGQQRWGLFLPPPPPPRAGAHLIVFVERGPFILVMASASGEPEAALTCQLGLVHAQILSILSSSVDKVFARNPSYDARKLLGATNHQPAALCSGILAKRSQGALFGVLLTQKAIVAVAQSRAHVLHPHDLLLLANLVRSNESFKQAQTFTPVCLPHFNSAAFLHAYVQYLHVSGGVCLVLLSSQPESFFKLADAAQQVHRQLKQPGVLQAIVSVTEHETGMICSWRPCRVKEGELQGVSKQIGDLETYVVGPSTAGTPAVLLLPDAFGFGIPNNKLYADHLARHGFLVAVPDIFHGDPHSTLLAGTDKVSAAVVAHGSFVTEDIVTDVKKPILFLFADQDRQIPEELRLTIDGIISKKPFPTKGKFYPGCEHGWALRGDDSDPKIKREAADAFLEAVSWFNAHG
ncbi:hypothetical protein WJX82_002800 [Trebouxia sp. C0006]